MAMLPSGTVTFLFTDIESSTKLAQSYPNSWEASRQRHDAILREAFESHQGHVFQMSGDAFCVAYATAPDALAAAISAQRALHQDSGVGAGLSPYALGWSSPRVGSGASPASPAGPKDAPAQDGRVHFGESTEAGDPPLRIHVRMGLHTGSAEARDGGYQGYLTLAHVQRVMAAAYGGQTLVSDSTAALLRGHLPEGITLRDMGEHRLKGLLNPEHLWQVVAPDLVQDFPPLQSFAAIANNLPIQVTSFIGRERELAELQHLLPTTRLLTLTGSGGTGKTRLSLQVAAEVLDSFKDGVWFIELAPLSDTALLPLTIASVLGVREDPGRPLLTTLLEWLRPKELLLILDNASISLTPARNLPTRRSMPAVKRASSPAAVRRWASRANWLTTCHHWRVPTRAT
jgi:class 3 adenylate cyclase